MTEINVNYELFVAPKKSDISVDALSGLLKKLTLFKLEDHDVVWGFNSDDDFQTTFNYINSAIGKHFEFGLISIDGSEENKVPNQCASNKLYLDFCIHRTRKEPSSDLLPIRAHFERHLKLVQDRMA